MAFDYAAVSVADTATSLLAGVDDNLPGRDTSRSIKVTNRGSASVFIAGPDVTASVNGGDELEAGESVVFDVSSNDVPYAITASGTVTVGVLHMGV